MLDHAIRACPNELWRSSLWENPDERPEYAQFWYLAYHCLFWLDLYLSGEVEGFAPPAPFTLDELDPAGLVPEKPYTKDELQAYLEYCRKKCQSTIGSLTGQTALRHCRFKVGVAQFHRVTALQYAPRAGTCRPIEPDARSASGLQGGLGGSGPKQSRLSLLQVEELMESGNPGVIPMIAYEDGLAAIDWLSRAFGFREREEARQVSPDGTLSHAEMEAGNGLIMLASPSPDYESPRHHRETCEQTRKWSLLPWIFNGILVYVNDLDAHYERAKKAGATILSPIEEGFPGRRYRVEDLEGHRWFFFEQ